VSAAIARSLVREGSPNPLGATWDGLGVNFALFSAHATKVELCIFDETGQVELSRKDLPEYTDEVWHGYLPDARPGTVYAYRVHGPFAPEAGHRFNNHKLLLDPYAKAHVGRLKWNPACYGYIAGDSDLTFDGRDSAPFMPKCQVIDPAFTWGRDHPPQVPWERTILYETHVRGFTQRHPAVTPDMRGTYAGLATRDVVDYIRSLGVTSVELLPVHTAFDDDFLVERGLVNYWGYNTIGFFAPDPHYAYSPGFAHAEFKQMVARLHDAGLEVILDVVYNHTAEGNERGATLSLRGIDNASYYRLRPDDRRYYINDTGTGNTVNLSHPRVLQMVTDSLRYWVSEMHVDGFRFDLATILAREDDGFDEGGGFLDSCRQDPVLSGVKLIAEPWDVGPGGYQVGQFPPGWAEWNDKFRDTTRAFWKAAAPASDMAARLSASAREFSRRGRRPWASVNFVTAHDGFPLSDVVAYNDKHNEANGEDNRDGSSNNNSWNCGVEGPTADPAINELRERQARNMLATLLLSQGTPMLLAGDEFGRTQGGNNNAYCQNNETSWLDWDLSGKARQRIAFVQELTALRHHYPILRRGRFLTGAFDAALGVKDVTWVHCSGAEMQEADWRDDNMRCFGMLLDGRAQATGIPVPSSDATMLIVLNAHHESVSFTLPEIAGGALWRLVFDTNALHHEEDLGIGDEYVVSGSSVLLFERLDRRQPGGVAPNGSGRRRTDAALATPAPEQPAACLSRRHRCLRSASACRRFEADEASQAGS